MDKYLSTTKAVVSLSFVAIAEVLNKVPLILAFYIIVVGIDFLTGLAKGAFNNQLSSSIGFKGLIKKCVSFIVVAVAFIIGFIIVEIGVMLNIDLGFAINIGFYATAVMLLNELTSILENAYAIIPDKIPIWLVKILKIAENATNDKIKGFICKNQNCDECELKDKCENKRTNENN